MHGVESPELIDLGEVVIFCRQPEYRDCRNALRRQLARHFDGGEGFVNRVGGSGKQPHLLPGDHRDRAGLSQPPQRFAIGVLNAQRVDQRRPAFIREVDLRGRRPIGAPIEGSMRVKTAHAIEVINQVGEQLRRVRQLGVPYTSALHAIL